MEQYSYPEPMPSMSAPIHSSATIDIGPTRPRRHTITRPDSAMALLSDLEDEEELDEEEQQETFDRISGILSNLIQEANDAVHGIEKERVHLIKKPNLPLNISTQRRSKTPRINTVVEDRPRKRTSYTPLTNTSISTPLLTTTPSPTQSAFKKQLFRHSAFRPRSCPVITPRRSLTPRKRNSLKDPILESFKRLDSSMALVDSLSRDLATTTPTTPTTVTNTDTRFTLLLLIPLLHIPHSLITMIFDFCSSTQPYYVKNNHSLQQSFSISSMIFWACVFAITNLMVDQVAVTPKNWLKTKTRRMSLPGSYTLNVSSASLKKPVKRTWIPSTVQQQTQFKLGENHQPKRRNSI